MLSNLLDVNITASVDVRLNSRVAISHGNHAREILIVVGVLHFDLQREQRRRHRDSNERTPIAYFA